MSRLQHLLELMCSVLIFAELISGNNDDMEVLIELKGFLQAHNQINRGAYDGWLESEASPCNWQGVGCDMNGRVSSLDLSSSSISGPFFGNFSGLKSLIHLDLSDNSIIGELPVDLNRCLGLKHLNLSYNLIGGVLNISSLTKLRTLDVSRNRFEGGIGMNFLATCDELTILNISSNNLRGNIVGLLDNCSWLEYVDLSLNHFTGQVTQGIASLIQFNAAENALTGSIALDMFPEGCKLLFLDLSSNYLFGNLPNSIANCSSLTYLSLSGNGFDGQIPPGIGVIPGLQKLILGSNNFAREMPFSLMNCTALKYLDISNNGFGGEVQGFFGKLESLTHLILHSNNYTDGIVSSGILRLPKLIMLDLSLNRFFGKLPTEVAIMTSIKYLVLAENNFSGQIPPVYGQIAQLQILDLSYNHLSGGVPADIGNLSSLLVLMLAGNQLSGEIPKEIGNCTSLLWLNLAENKLSGQIPPEIAGVGRDPSPTFARNQKDAAQLEIGTRKCLSVMRWIPLGYPGFNYVESEMSWKDCRSLEDRILKGYGIVTPPSVQPCIILGYVRFSGNLLSGQIPPMISAMRNFNLLLLDDNLLAGVLPSEISQMSLVVLNISRNIISGEIPSEIGQMVLLETLDMSFNNFSNELPSSLNQLYKLSKFNVSYNSLLSGNVPSTGQLSTFDEQSFLGDPLLSLHFIDHGPCLESNNDELSTEGTEKDPAKEEAMVLIISFIVFFFATIAIREHDSFMYVYYTMKCRCASAKIFAEL
ncbi:probable LRR receptor-like serine/threonine-protein kinase At1g74360 [Miscanthus floridulus]|uniref:probable LRR receptor-like serine/threonine-protein kinase At1g74360 n=1 Tax=Miscanthus floridulus TaxID=154761 RepID=UPI003458D987